MAASEAMDREAFEHWLMLYGSAWTDRDARRAASLYAEDATYQATPFEKPLRGQAVIYEYWDDVTKTEENVKFPSGSCNRCRLWNRSLAGIFCPRAAGAKHTAGRHLCDFAEYCGALPIAL